MNNIYIYMNYLYRKKIIPISHQTQKLFPGKTQT